MSLINAETAGSRTVQAAYGLPVDGFAAAAGSVPRIPTVLTAEDRFGSFLVRWGRGRMRYAVSPGLYAVGEPNKDSPVLVTANYKLTVDSLRSHLTGIDAWVLVLDTKGINVWCAAGKGTFGTFELVRRIEAAGLAEVVSHRRLILPQLGAVGIAAHKVKEAAGFSVLYGPVLAKDLPAYLAAGCVKTPAMRRVPFGFRDRAVLVPMELAAVKLLYPLLAAAGAAAGLLSEGRMGASSAAYAAFLLGSIFAGAAAAPLLLPWLPFRAFALKGAVAGLVYSAAAFPFLPGPPLLRAGLALAGSALASFLTMNFTGASAFTSQSGAVLEVKRGLPAQAGAALFGIAAVLAGGLLWK